MAFLTNYKNDIISIKDTAKKDLIDLDDKYRPTFLKYIKNCSQKFSTMKFLHNSGWVGGLKGGNKNILNIHSIGVYDDGEILVKVTLNYGTKNRYKELISKETGLYKLIKLESFYTEDLADIVRVIMESDFMEKYTVGILKKINN